MQIIRRRHGTMAAQLFLQAGMPPNRRLITTPSVNENITLGSPPTPEGHSQPIFNIPYLKPTQTNNAAETKATRHRARIESRNSHNAKTMFTSSSQNID